MIKTMVQSVAEGNQLYFKVFYPKKNKFVQATYKVDMDFKFRNYDTTDLGDCDFYDVSERELCLIYKYSVRISKKLEGLHE